jgi:Sulfotransferase family
VNFSARFDAFHEQACAATGLDDFGPRDYVEGMRQLLHDYDTHCRFSPGGVQAAEGSVVLALIGRLFDQQGIATHPEFAAAEIRQPIVILGPPRSGTTALHRLLAQDPANQWLAQWLGCTPMPRPPRDTWEQNRWYQMSKQGVDQVYAVNPAVKDIHAIFPDQADECHFIIEHSFWSPAYAGSANVPDYFAWIFQADTTPIYRRYRQVLGLIAGGDTRRWVLKDPCTHPFALDTLLKTFPDACIVFTHRDPVSAMKSLASLTWEVRHWREPKLTPQQHARYELTWWGKAIARADAARARLDPSRVIDVHVDEFNRAPLATAERIYRHFGLALTDAARVAWQRQIDTDPRAGHGVHRHAVSDWGLDESEILQGVGSYAESYARLYGNFRRA